MRQGTRLPLKLARPIAASDVAPASEEEHARQVEEREYAALMNRLFPDRKPLDVQTVADFNPHRW